MRTLAARVIAVDQMVRGASFANVFQQLVDEFGFEPRTAYTITLRVFRGGGLTKDALYLRGLVEILELFGGRRRFGAVADWQDRRGTCSNCSRVIAQRSPPPAPLRPKYLNSPEAQRRLDSISSQHHRS